MKFLADDNIWGKIAPPPGVGGTLTSDPVAGFAKFLGTIVSLFITFSAFILLIYLLWGAFDWIKSGGEKEWVAKAQAKITNALIGFLVIFIVLVVFGLFTGEILGIIKVTNGKWQISIPHL